MTWPALIPARSPMSATRVSIRPRSQIVSAAASRILLRAAWLRVSVTIACGLESPFENGHSIEREDGQSTVRGPDRRGDAEAARPGDLVGGLPPARVPRGRNAGGACGGRACRGRDGGH